MNGNKCNELVSIIMPSFNSEKTISQSIESVLNQSYSNWELLITDDKSYDSTVKIISTYVENDKRIKFFSSEVNGGAGKARNNSIKMAKGRFIAFLDADDLWLPDKLFKQINFMLENRYLFTYSQYQKFSSTAELGIIRPPKTISYQKLLYGNVIGCLTAIYDAESLGKHYMPLIRKRQDMGLWLEILKKVSKAYCYNEVLAKYRIDSGMTQNKFSVLKYQWLFYRQVVGLSFLQSLMKFTVYAYKGFIKSKK